MKGKFFLLAYFIWFSSCAKISEQNSDSEAGGEKFLPDSILVGQTLMVAAGKNGRSNKEVGALISKGRVGGVIFLKTIKSEVIRSVEVFDSIAKANGVPVPIYATDAEPGMFSNKISGVSPTPYNAQIKDEFESMAAAVSISEDLRSIGISWNYAPVVDKRGAGSIMGKRGFSTNSDSISSLAWTFASQSQKLGVAATAKHFPGHGMVKGDTHKGLFFIDGEFKELDPFKAMIDSGVASVMIGHLGVRNNEFSSEEMPASLSPRIVTDLLVKKLGFDGLIVTDAMNMGALNKIDEVEIKALDAGVHVVLMPKNPNGSFDSILKKMTSDEGFAKKVRDSGNKVLNFKKTYPH